MSYPIQTGWSDASKKALNTDETDKSDETDKTCPSCLTLEIGTKPRQSVFIRFIRFIRVPKIFFLP